MVADRGGVTVPERKGEGRRQTEIFVCCCRQKKNRNERTSVVQSQKGPYISGFISPSKNISFLIDNERLFVRAIAFSLQAVSAHDKSTITCTKFEGRLRPAS